MNRPPSANMFVIRAPFPRAISTDFSVVLENIGNTEGLVHPHVAYVLVQGNIAIDRRGRSWYQFRSYARPKPCRRPCVSGAIIRTAKCCQLQDTNQHTMARRTLPPVLVLGLITAVGPFAIDMYLPALPSMGKSLNASPPAVQMSLMAYFIAVGLCQLFYGPLSDIVGRKRPIYAGLTIFALGSIGCAIRATAAIAN
jgi:hypothetical protein